MKECGVDEPLSQWFSDYLTARSYRVKVGSTLGDERGVRCGVPQGSGCGPVCYLLHVDSLCGVLRHCSPHMFADDLCVLRAGAAADLADTCRAVQQDVDAVVRWSHDNGIVLNSDKTKLLILHSPYLNPSCSPEPTIVTHDFSCFHNSLFSCQCKPIERVKCITYLGMRIDENFSWSSHTDYICSKLRVLLVRFYHLRYRVPISTLKRIYNSLVESIIGYSLDCYGLTFKSNIEKIEKLQTRFLKLLVSNKTKNKYKNDYYKLFKICKILPATLRHKYLFLVRQHGNQESNLYQMSHNHGTRSIAAGKYAALRVSNYYGDRLIEKRLPYLLNTLPVTIRQEKNKNKFKRPLFQHYLNTYLSNFCLYK
ncbi:uncharacterized protein LOC133521414 [Cydia pomonella]|uniref:uncharacterized protein LOC133521414 n=1 Tax=Cydia pomonella TaxID=82600 RepID=UPI002ADE8E97|nr:uncharacterized protein LOC133521414 [Cydia pomonella]